jgi:hypothetical protein
MKRILNTVAALSVLTLATSAFASNEPYGWTISASPTDPFQNTATPTFGVTTYYLWLACCDLPDPLQDGMSAAEMDLVATGSTLLATITQNNFLNAGGTSNLLLAVGGCPCGPVVAANLLVTSLPGNICIAPSAANGILGAVDCAPAPSLHGIDWVGLDLGGGACGMGLICEKPVSLEATNWGTIKGLYR